MSSASSRVSTGMNATPQTLDLGTPKLVAGLFVSLDGVTDSPERWQMPYYDKELGAVVAGIAADADAVLFGARSFKRFRAVFKGKTDADLPFADLWNRLPKYVVSSTLEALNWHNSHLLTGDLAEAITELKRQPGSKIVVGASPTLVRWLLDQGLLDELHLTIHPVIVGAERRLFEPAPAGALLELLSSRQLGSGVIYAVYATSSCARTDESAA